MNVTVKLVSVAFAVKSTRPRSAGRVTTARYSRPAADAGSGMLLGRDSVVDTVATLPKILAVAEASVGQGMRAGQFIGSIKREGGPPLGLHAGSELAAGAVPGAQLRADVLHAVRRHDGGGRRHARRAGFGGVAALSHR